MPKTRASFSLTSEPITEVGACISLLGSLSNGSHIYPHQAAVAESAPTPRAFSVKMKKTFLVKRHQINAKMCCKLDEIKHEGWMLRLCPVFWALHNSCSLKRVFLNEGLVAVFRCVQIAGGNMRSDPLWSCGTRGAPCYSSGRYETRFKVQAVPLLLKLEGLLHLF